MTIVFDFDYTLFDTVRFKEVISEIGRDAAALRSAEFVRPGAVALLERLRAEGWAVMLMTLGAPEWQRRKVEISGLAPHFERTMYAPESKEAVAHMLEDLKEPIVMVNDNGGEIDALQKRFPSFRMIAVRSPKPLPSDPAIPVCDTMEDIYKAISQR